MATLSRTDRCGISAKFWKTIPIFWLRKRCRARVPSAMTSVPSISIFPSVGSSRRLTCRTRVDLPLPDSPMTQKISPRVTLRLTPATPTTALNSARTSAFESPRLRIAASASAGRSPKIFQTLEISITVSDMRAP